MVQTIDEIAEILKALKLDTEINSEETEKILTSINSKLESIADDYAANSLLKDYIVDLRQTLDARHGYTIDKYNEFENSFKSINEIQQTAIKSSDLDELLQKINSNIETIKNSYIDKSSENVQNLSAGIDNLNLSLDNVNDKLSEKISLDFDTTRDLIENISTEISKWNETLINENQSIDNRNSNRIQDLSGSIRALEENINLQTDNYREMLELKTSDLKDFMNSNTTILASSHVSLENKLTEKLSAIENLSHGFEANIIDVNNNLQSVIQNLLAMDTTGQNDIIKRELENIFITSDAILSTLKIFDQKNDELAKMISNLTACENNDLFRQQTEDITDKINALETAFKTIRFEDNFTDLLNKTTAISSVVEDVKNIVAEFPKSDDTDGKFCELNEKLASVVTDDDFNTFRSDLTDFIQKIVDTSNYFNNGLSENKEKLEQILQSLQSSDAKEMIREISDTVSENSAKNLTTITTGLDVISEKLDNAAFNFQHKADENAEKITDAINDINVKISLFNKEVCENIIGKYPDLSVVNESLHDFIGEINDIYKQTGSVIEEKLSAKLFELEKSFAENADRYNEKLAEFKSDSEKFNHEFSSSINTKTEDILFSLEPLKNDLRQIIEYDFSSKLNELKEQLGDVYTYVTTQTDLTQNQTVTEKLENFYRGLLEKIAIVDENMNIRSQNNLELIKSAIEEIKHLSCSNMSINSQFMEEEKAFMKEIDEKIVQFSSNCAGVLANVPVDITNALNSRLETVVEELRGYIGAPVSADDLVFAVDNLKNEFSARIAELENKQCSKEDYDRTKEELLLILNQLSEKIDETVLRFSDNGFDEHQTQFMSELNNFKDSIISMLNETEKSSQNSIKSIQEKIELLSGNYSDVTLYNKINDIYDKTDEISERLNLQSSSESTDINETLYSIEDKVSASSEVNEKIAKSLLNIAEKYSTLSRNSKQNTDILQILQEKLSSFSEKDVSDFDTLQSEIENIKSLIENQRQYFKDDEISDRTIAITDCLHELEKKIDDIEKNAVGTIDLTANANDIKESLTEAIANVFTQISFIEETEEIKGYVEEKTDAVSAGIQELRNLLQKLACNTGDETYSYSLQDVESDIAKLRLILNKISESASNDELNRLSDNVANVENTLKDLHNTLTQEEFAGFREDFEKINEDIVSISSRTNKLLLNSDNSYKSLNDGINAFKGMVNNLNEKIDNLSAVEIQKRIEQKITNINNAVTASVNSNKVIREVLMYLGEWMDTTTENINFLSEKTSEISNSCGKFTSVNSAIKELKKTLPEKSDLLTTLENKFEEQQERIAGLETKLEKVLKVLDAASDTKLTKKVDKIEKLINKLSTNVEKLASHVVEE